MPSVFITAPSTRVAIRLLLTAVVIEGAATVLLGLEAVGTHRENVLRVFGWTAIALVGALWVCTWVMYAARRRALDVAHDVQHRLSAFVGTANELLWETTADGVVTYVGPRAEPILGYRYEDLIGRGVDVVLAAKEHARASKLLADSLAERRGWSHERFTMLAFDGREKDMYSSAHIRLSPHGVPVGFTGTLREVESNPELDAEFDRLRTGIQTILDNRAIQPVFQPIVSLASGAVIGAEALSRVTTYPVTTPDVLFKNAADVGLGTELDLLAMDIALSHATELPQDLYISVNLTPATLGTGMVPQALSRSPLPCRRIVVEITEHASVTDYGALAEAVAEIRSLGVRVAVDDAGAGYASFRHILRLRPDFIKLDRALIDGLDQDPAKRALATAFVTFGRDVDARIIAEGVETAEEVNAARSLGMHAAQGYHTGRPAPADHRWGAGIGH